MEDAKMMNNASEPKGMQVLAVIPARGGSKGLPGKNIRKLDGHPLISFSIAAAKQSVMVTRTVCSTDSHEIAHIAEEYGAEIPFIRPAELAADDSTDLEVFMHLLKWFRENEKYIPDLVVQLRPTSPLRVPGLVDEGIRKLISRPDADSLRTVCISPKTPYKMWRIETRQGLLEPLLTLEDNEEPYNSPRQALPDVWWQTGTLDITRPELILSRRSMTGKKIVPMIVDRELAIDIDSLEDFERAQSALKKYQCIRPR